MPNLSEYEPVKGVKGWIGFAVAVLLVVLIAKKLPLPAMLKP